MVHSRLSSCVTCGLQRFCLPRALNRAETYRLAQCLEHLEGISAGRSLFRQGGEWKGLYVVHSGLVVTYQKTPTGLPRMADFWGPGSVLGAEDFEGERYSATAKAVNRLSLRWLNKPLFERLLQEQPRLESSLLRIAGQVLNRKRATRALLQDSDPGQILPRYLRALATGFASEGVGPLASPWLTRLALPRWELGSCLELGESDLEQAANQPWLREKIRLETDRLVVPDVGALFREAGSDRTTSPS